MLENPGLVLIQWSRDPARCGNCGATSPHVKAAAREFAGRVTVVYVDVDAPHGLYGKYGPGGGTLPFLSFYRGGGRLGGYSQGPQSIGDIRGMIRGRQR